LYIHHLARVNNNSGSPQVPTLTLNHYLHILFPGDRAR
jgi:hypothetical protein